MGLLYKRTPGDRMHWEHLLEARWDNLREKIRRQWSLLSEDDLSSIRGNGQQLVTMLVERYQQNLETVNRDVDGFFAECEKELEEREGTP